MNNKLDKTKTFKELINSFFIDFTWEHEENGYVKEGKIVSINEVELDPDRPALSRILKGETEAFILSLNTQSYHRKEVGLEDGTIRGKSSGKLYFYLKDGTFTDPWNKQYNFISIFKITSDDLKLLAEKWLDQTAENLDYISYMNINTGFNILVDRLVERNFFDKYTVEERLQLVERLNNDKIFPKALADLFIF